MLRRSLFAAIGGLLASAHQLLGKLVERLPEQPEIKIKTPEIEAVPTECHIRLKWPGTRLTVCGTGYLCIVDVNGTQWSQMHIEPDSEGKVVYGDVLTDKQGRRYCDVAGAETGLKMLFKDGVREGVSRDEFPPLRNPVHRRLRDIEEAFLKAVDERDKWIATMLIAGGHIDQDKGNAAWKAKYNELLIQ